MIKKLLSILTLAIAVLFSGLANAASVDVNANANDVAIKGYDPVAYFVKGKAVKGKAEYTAAYKDTIYQFSSKKNRNAFRKNPESYAPQFGGFCAYGVTQERKFNIDPEAWKIVDGKLYLNYSKNVQKIWLKDIPGNITSANGIWIDIKDYSDEVLEDR
jgi:YHS domain-containing protein